MTDRVREVLAEIAKSIHPQCPDDMLVIVTSTDGGIVSTRFPVKVGDIRSALRHEASAPQPMAGGDGPKHINHHDLKIWRSDCPECNPLSARLVPSQPDTGTNRCENCGMGTDGRLCRHCTENGLDPRRIPTKDCLDMPVTVRMLSDVLRERFADRADGVDMIWLANAIEAYALKGKNDG